MTDRDGRPARRAQDVQALHRRRLPPVGERPVLAGGGRQGRFLANAALASRKDARDAVAAARKAFGGWSTRPPYNRGQILYRVAEMLEGRREQFVLEVPAARGVTARRAQKAVDAASTDWSGTPAGPTSLPRSPARAIRSPDRTSTSRCLSPPGSSRSSLRRNRHCSDWSASWHR